MRVFRLVAGALVALVGLAVLAAGAVAAFWVVGPDDVVSTRAEPLSSKGVAVVSAPTLVDYYGSRLVVSARPTAKGRPVFLGVAHHIETSSYLGDSARTELTDVGYPSSLATREVNGSPARVTPPDALDWWVARATGSGTQVLEWELADGPYDLVVMAADGRPGVEVTTTFGLEVEGAFRTSLVGAGLGLLVLAGGVLLLRGSRGPRGVDDDEDVLWEGREVWDQNEFWGAGEPVTRGGATVGPGGGPAPPPDQVAFGPGAGPAGAGPVGPPGTPPPAAYGPGLGSPPESPRPFAEGQLTDQHGYQPAASGPGQGGPGQGGLGHGGPRGPQTAPPHGFGPGKGQSGWPGVPHEPSDGHWEITAAPGPLGARHAGPYSPGSPAGPTGPPYGQPPPGGPAGWPPPTDGMGGTDGADGPPRPRGRHDATPDPHDPRGQRPLGPGEPPGRPGIPPPPVGFPDAAASPPWRPARPYRHGGGPGQPQPPAPAPDVRRNGEEPRGNGMDPSSLPPVPPAYDQPVLPPLRLPPVGPPGQEPRGPTQEGYAGRRVARADTGPAATAEDLAGGDDDASEPPPWLPGPVGPVFHSPTRGKDDDKHAS